MLGLSREPERPQEGDEMAKFISLLNWTDQGAKDAAGTVERSEAAKALATQMGGSLEVFWTMGQHDMVAILDFPDDETGVAFLAKVTSLGNLRSSTMRAFTADEVNAIMAKG
jgi:uncharacterized protein with GYD domain